MKKKVLWSLSLTAIILTFCMSFNVNAAGLTQERKVEVLTNLGIIDGYEENADVTVQMFADVIDTLLGEGSSSMYFEKTSRSRSLKYGEMLPVLIDITGYTPRLDTVSASNEKMKYAYLGKSIGIVYDLSMDFNKKLTMGEYARLLASALLDVGVMKQVSAGSEISYKKTDENALHRFLGYTYIDGIVQSAGGEGIEAGYNSDCIVIGKTVYRTGKYFDPNTFLGRNVRAFIDENDVVKALSLIDSNNKEIIIKSEDISDGASTDNNRLEYFDLKGKKRSVLLETGIDVIYNGERTANFSPEDFANPDGNITLVDNNGDNKYDVALIERYTDVRLATFSESSKLLIDTNNNVYKLEDFYNDGYRFIGENGSDVAFTQLSKNDILSLRYTKGGKLNKIMQSARRINGVYLGQENNYDKLKVDDTYYETTNSFRRNTSGIEGLKAGDTLTIYLNFNGKVADYIVYSANEAYAYILDASNDGAFEDNVRLKVLHQDNSIKVLTIADKFLLNGVSHRAKTFFEDKATSSDGKAIEQLVILRTNNAGKIVSITTAVNDSKFGGFGYSGLTLNYDTSDGSKLRPLYRTEGCIIGAKYYATSSTNVFRINDQEPDKSYVIKGGSIPTGITYDMKIYNVDKNYIPKAIVISVAANSQWIDYYIDTYVVEGFSKMIDEEGTPYDAIELRRGDNVRTYKISEDMMLPSAYCAWEGFPYRDKGTFTRIIPITDVPVGSIIQIKSDNDGIYAYIPWVLPGDNRPFEGGEISGYSNGVSEIIWAGQLHCFGKVLSRTQDGLIMNFHEPTADEQAAGKVFPIESWNRLVLLQQETAALFFESSRNKIYSGTVAEIEKDDMLYLQTDGSTIKNIVVYR